MLFRVSPNRDSPKPKHVKETIFSQKSSIPPMPFLPERSQGGRVGLEPKTITGKRPSSFLDPMREPKNSAGGCFPVRCKPSLIKIITERHVNDITKDIPNPSKREISLPFSSS